MSNVTTGLYKSSADAANAVRYLEAQGIPSEDINMVASDDFNRDGFIVEPHSKAPEGFAIGAAGGGAIGALLAGLTAVGTIATGGAGLGLLAAGPIVAAIVGGGAGATAGSIVGGMVGAAIPEHDLEYYEKALKAGSVLIGVKTEDGESKKVVKQALAAAGAEKIS
ncbi:MAG TPA: hypothetical protein VK629_13130 [Steroidobacteraceae bacterium]|nr:hypothetical protein [Steroidobacteraceae bacterium]